MTGQDAAAPSWHQVVDALLADQDALVVRQRDALLAELPSYDSIPVDVLDAAIALSFATVMRAARAGDDFSDAEVAGLSAAGEQRALQGVPVEDVLRGWRIATQLVTMHAREIGEGLGVAPADLLDLVLVFLARSDQAMEITASAHRRAELALAREDQERRAALVRGMLRGNLSAAAVHVQAGAYGLDTGQEYLAVRAAPAEGTTTLQLERALGFHDDRPRGLCALMEDDLAGFLPALPAGTVPGIVGVGPPRPLDRLAESFRLATRALVPARAFGLTGVHRFEDLSIRPAIVVDADVGAVLHERYVVPLGGSASAEETMGSLRAYLRCGMHVDTAAQQLFVHPNTVRYRLARFEELSGASLRDPVTAAEVWWALERAGLEGL